MDIKETINQINNERNEEAYYINAHRNADYFMRYAKIMYDEAINNGFSADQACYYAGEYIKQFWKPIENK